MISGFLVCNAASRYNRPVMPDYVAAGAGRAVLKAGTRHLAVELTPMNIRLAAFLCSPAVIMTRSEWL